MLLFVGFRSFTLHKHSFGNEARIDLALLLGTFVNYPAGNSYTENKYHFNRHETSYYSVWTANNKNAIRNAGRSLATAYRSKNLVTWDYIAEESVW